MDRSHPINREPGTYICSSCDQPENPARDQTSMTQTPSDFRNALPNAIVTHPESASGVNRTSLHCSVCNVHLGHEEDDGECSDYTFARA